MEPDNFVSVLVVNNTGNSTYNQLIGTSDGTFNITVQLAEGTNKLSIATGSLPPSDNNTIVEREVILNTVYPVLTIDSPDHSPVYMNHLWAEIVGHVGHPEYTDFIPFPFGLPYNQTSGVFSRSIELHEGENLVPIRYSDAFGNEVVHWFTFIVDLTPPMVLIERPDEDPYYTNDPMVVLQGIAGNGTKLLQFLHKDQAYDITTIEGDLNTSATWEYILELGPLDLEQDITVIAVDHVGNEASDTIRVIYDTIPPSLIIDEIPLYSDNGLVYVNGTTEMDIEDVFIDDTAYPVVDGVFSILLNVNKGRNEFVVSVRDKAGNEANETFEVWFGTDPPALKVDVPDRTDSTTVKIKGTTDTDVDTVSINGAKHPVVDGKFSVEVDLTEGDNKFLVEVLDSEGNKASRTVVVEHSTPGFGVAMAVALLAVVSALMAKRRSWR